jgi:formate/nitrite transporter FocA (FNT family)
MATSDAYNVSDTIELISAIGVKKSKQRIDHMMIKSFLAGALLSFGGLFLLIVGGGGAPLAQSLGPGIHKMIQAAVFPIGLVLIVITGADLFTGNTMVLVVSTLHRKTTWLDLIISWIVSFFGNLGGCLFFQYILVYYAGLLSNDPYRSFTMKLAEVKGDIEWYQILGWPKSSATPSPTLTLASVA